VSDRTAATRQETFSLRRVLTGTQIPPLRIVVASAGFLARGGVLLFAIPIWVLPTPVGVTLLLPADAVGASGLAPGFVRVLVVLIACLVAVACLAAVAAAIVEADTYGWLTAGPGSPGSGGEPAPGSGAAGTPSLVGIVGRLLVVEAIATVPVALTAWVAVGRLAEVGRQEYLLPSSLDTAFAIRVLNGARVEVALLVASVLLADLVHAVLARLVMERVARTHSELHGRTRASPGVQAPAGVRAPAGPEAPAGLAGSSDVAATTADARVPRSVRSLVRRVLAVAAAWLAGWVLTMACVVPGVGVLLLGWGSVRDAYLGPGFDPSALDVVLLLVPTVLLASAWLLAAVLAGIASLVRSALWTAAMRA
jgi:hypothetical protein